MRDPEFALEERSIQILTDPYKSILVSGILPQEGRPRPLINKFTPPPPPPQHKPLHILARGNGARGGGRLR